MEYVTIRYSQMYYRGHFMVKEGLEVKPGDLCLVKSPRGLELGKVLCDPVSYDGNTIWLKNSKTHGEKQGDRACLYLSGEIIRIATEDDIEKMRARFARGTQEEMSFCEERIASHCLPMKLAGVEYLFEGEKIIFYFLADGRVDFRNLVKDLAKRYRTRIEMKQIGVRDEARLLAEYEHCGRRLCCKGFLNNLEPVTMKMAKSQKTTLDPSKISGRCGRLMCCLRYEDHVYQELKDNLPKKGTQVKLKGGRARVLSQDILLQRVLVETEAGVHQFIKAEEILEEEHGEVLRPKKPKSRPKPPHRSQKGRKNKDPGKSRR
ncbi:MAG: PSP1 domain-containing protein [Planctomycetota bacterium]